MKKVLLGILTVAVLSALGYGLFRLTESPEEKKLRRANAKVEQIHKERKAFIKAMCKDAEDGSEAKALRELHYNTGAAGSRLSQEDVEAGRGKRRGNRSIQQPQRARQTSRPMARSTAGRDLEQPSGELVGTIEEPKEYVKGTLPMRWGLLRDAGRPTEEPPLVYFGGRTETTVFGFGGSSRHVIGNAGASATGSRSATPYLVAHLLDGLDMSAQGWRANRKHDGDDDYDTFSAIALATDHLKGPEQNLEFYAKIPLARFNSISPYIVPMLT